MATGVRCGLRPRNTALVGLDPVHDLNDLPRGKPRTGQHLVRPSHDVAPETPRQATAPPDSLEGVDRGTVERVLAEQQRYYRARAPEYDDWWFRRGAYALDPETEARWFADVRELEAALETFGPRGDVLELAAGTGRGPGSSSAWPTV